MSAASPTLESVLAYCRDARRVRGRFAGEFGRMHASLRELPTPAERESESGYARSREAARSAFEDVEIDIDRASWSHRPDRARPTKFVAARVGEANTPAVKQNILPVPEAANAFAARVLAARRDGAIRYDVRARLLAAADQLGIERFEANLIIARVEHRFGQPAAAPVRKSHVRLLVLALLLQAAIITAGMLLLG